MVRVMIENYPRAEQMMVHVEAQKYGGGSRRMIEHPSIGSTGCKQRPYSLLAGIGSDLVGTIPVLGASAQLNTRSKRPLKRVAYLQILTRPAFAATTAGMPSKIHHSEDLKRRSLHVAGACLLWNWVTGGYCIRF